MVRRLAFHFDASKTRLRLRSSGKVEKGFNGFYETQNKLFDPKVFTFVRAMLQCFPLISGKWGKYERKRNFSNLLCDIMHMCEEFNNFRINHLKRRWSESLAQVSMKSHINKENVELKMRKSLHSWKCIIWGELNGRMSLRWEQQTLYWFNQDHVESIKLIERWFILLVWKKNGWKFHSTSQENVKDVELDTI